ncbi:glycosyltransferase [Paramagnetospirillum caucaseum]|uniref:Glycosyltransferase n=1 Tax=Paramagnetospirillum caucaseum TaxID=1244869 RepID=M2Z0I6_9PROT|nr:glycosyltransferase family 1 protein [Paramagnetospirillum caucaseum]EME67795.1 glycosyltransferase [Paramagnetospirillum caucaseum]
MKILVNAISARIGGIVTYTRNLARSLAERKVDATIAVSARFPENGLPLWHHWASDLRPLSRFLWEQTFWRRTVARLKPDVLFSSANFGLLSCPVPQILLIREGGLFDPFYLANCTPAQGVAPALQRSVRRRLILESARRSDRVVTPTLAMRELLLHWAPDLASRIEVNSYGTMSESFSPSSGLRRDWRVDGCLRLIYVSVYYPHKQPELVCRAVAELNRTGRQAHATISMDIRETEDFRGGLLDRHILTEASARGDVTLGRRPYESLPELYRTHDVFVFPSISETFGHPMVEAMGCGLPVVAADTPVNREICGDAALYFEPLSLSALLDCLSRLEGDPQLRAALIARGRQRVVESFTWESHVDRLIQVFREVAEDQDRKLLDSGAQAG